MTVHKRFDYSLFCDMYLRVVRTVYRFVVECNVELVFSLKFGYEGDLEPRIAKGFNPVPTQPFTFTFLRSESIKWYEQVRP